MNINSSFKAIIYAVVFIVVVIFIFSSPLDFALKISFSSVFISLFVGGLYYLHFQNFSIAHGAVIVFSFLFYFLAPILQLSDNSHILINTVKYDLELLLYSNIYVLLFIVVYFCTYIYISRRNNIVHYVLKPVNTQLVKVLIFLSIFFAYKGLQDIIILFSNFDFDIDGNERITVMFERKVLYMFPYITLSLIILRRRFNLIILSLCVFLLILLFLTKNPVLDRRNALGPVYISLLIFGLEKFIRSNIRIFMLFFFTMVILFPLTSLLTHVAIDDWGQKSIDNRTIFTDHFTDLHYDAWANIPAVITYVDKEGFQLGHQLLGSLAFWVPRSIWGSKPVSTGEELGIFLMRYENLHFNNISSTVIVEGYIDFGVIGICLFGVVCACFVRKLDKYYHSASVFEKVFSVYSSVFLFFILRGALLPAVAYLVGAWIAILVAPRIINILILYLIPKIPVLKIRWI